ncbi:MAG: DegT/DnrJ/EryC1/StrS family aminotransferase [Prevotella sp.]|nr:DegT/DnrJ/EryC1/StrS family aminotransferase [Prevotella sp.]
MIPYISLAKRTQRHQQEILEATNRVVASGWFLLGPELQNFEQEYASYIQSRYCVGVGNGLDALTLIYRAYIEMGMMQPGDEVIVPANTYIASILAITENQLVPILVEPRPESLQIDENLIEQKITPRTKSVMIVHLYGRCAYTDKIGQICKTNNLLLVEDNAQAHGCRFGGKMTGRLGHAAGHSFYPTKNLGALGDSGAVTTDDPNLAEMVRMLRNYGSARKYEFSKIGRNSRMDEIQAAILSVRLKHLEEDNLIRRRLANCYNSHLSNPMVHIPEPMPEEQNVWHIYPILVENRSKLQAYLQQQGVETQVHYPVPPHKQACYRQWNNLHLPITEYIHSHELSLPIGPELSVEEAENIAEAVNRFDY